MSKDRARKIVLNRLVRETVSVTGVFLLSAIACGGGMRQRPVAAPLEVDLVQPDSAEGEDGTTVVWFRVAVRGAATVDTLTVMVGSAPVIRPDGRVTGLEIDSAGSIVRGFLYRPATRELSRVQMPADLSPLFPEATLSASGDLVAYVGRDSAGVLAATLRRCFNHVRWAEPETAEFAIRVERGEGPWAHVRLTPPGVVDSVDSLSTEPPWPQHGF